MKNTTAKRKPKIDLPTTVRRCTALDHRVKALEAEVRTREALNAGIVRLFHSLMLRMKAVEKLVEPTAVQLILSGKQPKA